MGSQFFRKENVNFSSVIFVVLALLGPLAQAESGAVTLSSTQALAAHEAEAESVCQRVKENPHCSNSIELMRQVIGVTVPSCQAQVAALKCQDLISQFPEYKSHLMSCEPYEVCKTALQSNAGEGCLQYGIEMTNKAVDTLRKIAICGQRVSCVEKHFLSFLKSGVDASVDPMGTAFRLGQKSAAQLIEDFNKDKVRFQKIACLDAETQAQFMCSLYVKYGFAVAGTSVGAASAAKLVVAKMAGLEATLAAEAALAEELRAVEQKALQALPEKQILTEPEKNALKSAHLLCPEGPGPTGVFSTECKLNKALACRRGFSAEECRKLLDQKVLGRFEKAKTKSAAAKSDARETASEAASATAQTTINISKDAKQTLQELSGNPAQSKRWKAVDKTLKMMGQNLRHPSLNPQKYYEMKGPNGEQIMESYAQNGAPRAYRVFWYYGPKKGEITIYKITAHP